MQILGDGINKKIENVIVNSSAIDEIKKLLSISKDGIYYFVDFFQPSCVCYSTFKELISTTSKIGYKLNAVLLEDWNIIQLTNLCVEMDSTINVEKANVIIIDHVKKWQESANRNGFNLIALKRYENIKIYPLFNQDYYSVWNKFIEEDLSKYFSN